MKEGCNSNMSYYEVEIDQELMDYMERNNHDSYFLTHKKRVLLTIKYLKYFNIVNKGICVNIGAGEDELRESIPTLIKKAFPNSTIVPNQGDLRFPMMCDDSVYDGGMCLEVFEHISDPDIFDSVNLSGISNLISEIMRCLKPGARFLLTTPNVCSVHSLEKLMMGMHPYLAPHHYREYANYEIKRILLEFGAHIIAFNSENVFPFWEGEFYDNIKFFLDINMFPQNVRGQDFFIVFEKPHNWDEVKYKGRKLMVDSIFSQNFGHRAYKLNYFSLMRDCECAVSKNSDNVTCVFGYGFSEPEDNFVWCEKPEACMAIMSSLPIKTICLNVIPFCNEKCDCQNITIFVNDNEIMTVTLTAPSVITISDKDAVFTNCNSLKFRCKNAISPQKLGINEDERELSIAIEKILVR